MRPIIVLLQWLVVGMVWAGRFAPGCVYRGGRRGCAPFSRNLFEATTSVIWPSQRECYDVNVGIETMYIFTSITTWTTSTTTSLNKISSSFVSFTTVSSITTSTTLFNTTTITTFLQTNIATQVVLTVTTTIPGLTTFTSVITGTVVIPVSYSTTMSGNLPISSQTVTLYVTQPTVIPTTSTSTYLSTTTFFTGAIAGGLNIGTQTQDWSYLTDRCQPSIIYDGDPINYPYIGGANLTVNSGNGPFFLQSNKEYQLFPCESLQLWASFSLARNTTVDQAFGVSGAYSVDDDPAYGAGLFGAFDPISGFSFYFIVTQTKVYAMYSRVPLRCGCQASAVGAINVGSGCTQPCVGDDRLVDAEFPFPEDSPYPSPVVAVAKSLGNDSLGKLSFVGLLENGFGSGLPNDVHEKFGFEYYSFTYLVPIANLNATAENQVHQYSIDLNPGVPSVTWRVDGQNLLTITPIGSPIDSRFQVANYGGSDASTDFPASVQLAVALLAVSESTKNRTACQGLFNQCYLDQTIQDARYTGCIYGPVADPNYFTSNIQLKFQIMSVQRIRKIPRPCCATYAK